MDPEAVDEQFSFAVTMREDGAVVVSGEVDMSTCEQVVDAANAGAASPVPIDLAAVSFMDSSGIRALVRIHNARGLQLIAQSDAVSHILAISGLEGHFASG